MKTRVFVITIILLLLVTLIVQVKVLPSWENAQIVFLVSTFILALTTGLLSLFKLWFIHNKKKSKTEKFIKTAVLITLSPLVFLFAMPIFDETELVDEFTIANQNVYVYYENCFPPDSSRECDYYGSSVYLKNQYLPVMHLVLKTDFYVGDVQIINKVLIANASDICPKDT